MKNFIKRTLRVIYNFQPMLNYYPHATGFKVFKWKLGRCVRNVSILALFVITGYGSARVYNYLSPVTVYADREVIVTVQATSTMPSMLKRICTAESGFKQFNKNGTVVRGMVNPSDIGICQINEPINNDLARKLGFDIYTEKGNLEFAQYLFNERGVQPWMASACTATGWGRGLGYCNK